MVVAKAPQLAPRRESASEISLSRVPSGQQSPRPPQTMQLQFQKTALVPAFRELRAHDIYASTPKLAASQSCAHGDLSHRPTLPTYLFFHSQDRCIETPASQLTCTPRFVAPEERSYTGFFSIPTLKPTVLEKLHGTRVVFFEEKIGIT